MNRQSLKQPKNYLPILFSWLFMSLLMTNLANAQAATDDVPLPDGLKYSIQVNDDSERILNAFLGIPYRIDGAIDESGRYTLFSKSNKPLKSAGLNCSGFVLEASRFLLANNISLATAQTDRLQDSGKDSEFGEDWDFGFDLILNIADGLPATFLLPNGVSLDKQASGVTGLSPRGFDLHAPATWSELPTRLQPDHLYLVSFNRDSAKKEYPVQHYHVGLINVSQQGEIWLYQTTGTAKKVYRRNLTDKQQRAQFLRSFANTAKVKKYILILDIPLKQE